MGLHLERRDDSGRLVFRVRSSGGVFMLPDDLDTLSVEEARGLAKLSAHLPLERRDWALRIGSDDQG